MYVLPPPKEEMSKRKVSLTCLVINFQPEDIHVEWQRNGESEPEDSYRTTPPVLDSDGSFFLYSKLQANKNEWKQGDKYSCVVMHEALHYHYTQRAISESSGK